MTTLQLLQEGVILVFPLVVSQSDELLENIRQEALVYFSTEERQKRHIGLVDDWNKKFPTNTAPYSAITPFKGVILSIQNRESKRASLWVYGRAEKNSQFGNYGAEDCEHKMAHQASNDSFVYFLP